MIWGWRETGTHPDTSSRPRKESKFHSVGDRNPVEDFKHGHDTI